MNTIYQKFCDITGMKKVCSNHFECDLSRWKCVSQHQYTPEVNGIEARVALCAWKICDGWEIKYDYIMIILHYGPEAYLIIILQP